MRDLVQRLRSMAEYRQQVDLGDRRDLRAAAVELEALRGVAEAAASVASEPNVRDELLCYVMGMETITRLNEWRALKETR